MVAAETPTYYFFIKKNMAFWTAISPRSKKNKQTNAVGTWRIAINVTGA
jgi:hypothetical protein